MAPLTILGIAGCRKQKHSSHKRTGPLVQDLWWSVQAFCWSYRLETKRAEEKEMEKQILRTHKCISMMYINNWDMSIATMLSIFTFAVEDGEISFQKVCAEVGHVLRRSLHDVMDQKSGRKQVWCVLWHLTYQHPTTVQTYSKLHTHLHYMFTYIYIQTTMKQKELCLLWVCDWVCENTMSIHCYPWTHLWITLVSLPPPVCAEASFIPQQRSYL